MQPMQRSHIPHPGWDPSAQIRARPSPSSALQNHPKKHSRAPSAHGGKALPHTYTPPPTSQQQHIHLQDTTGHGTAGLHVSPPQQEGSPAVSAPTQRCSASCPHSTAARRGAQRPSQIGRWDGMGGGLTRGGQVAAVSAATHSRRDGQRVTVGSTAPWAPHGHPMGTPIPTAPSSWGAAALSHSGSSSGVTAG